MTTVANTPSDGCAHENLSTTCAVVRYYEYIADAPEARMAEISIRCLDCGSVAKFKATGGLAPHEPRTSFFGTELRAPFQFIQLEEEGGL